MTENEADTASSSISSKSKFARSRANYARVSAIFDGLESIGKLEPPPIAKADLQTFATKKRRKGCTSTRDEARHVETQTSIQDYLDKMMCRILDHCSKPGTLIGLVELRESRGLPKNELLEKMLEIQMRASPADLILVSDAPGDSMPNFADKVLQGFFPIMSTSGGTQSTAYTLKDFFSDLEMLSEHHSGSVFDASTMLPNWKGATRVTTVREMREAFGPEPPVHSKNFLDISNNTGQTFTPRAVSRHSLLHLIRVRALETFGKTDMPVVRDDEFFLASTVHSVSPYHTDRAGKCVWIQILEGSKEWYTIKGNDVQIRHAFSSPSRGIDADCTVHAVRTTKPTLTVGGHFYTAETFHLSLDVFSRQLSGEYDSNEDISARDWLDVTKVVENLHDNTIFSARQRLSITNSLRAFAQKSKEQIQASGKTAQGNTNLQRFVAVAEAWIKEYTA
ncbi:hypothetical protein FH972_024089 [Carpinus fangiana]|uniref:JmjC domain-containing protein n=1 Tax=Carpinus fangiana TaxID=176857 RepID=A0A5N6KXB5_9ROSI|nr:hypothetical protein FH972_024089 [Carpinus fangiana]